MLNLNKRFPCNYTEKQLLTQLYVLSACHGKQNTHKLCQNMNMHKPLFQLKYHFTVNRVFYFKDVHS